MRWGTAQVSRAALAVAVGIAVLLLVFSPTGSGQPALGAPCVTTTSHPPRTTTSHPPRTTTSHPPRTTTTTAPCGPDTTTTLAPTTTTTLPATTTTLGGGGTTTTQSTTTTTTATPSTTTTTALPPTSVPTTTTLLPTTTTAALLPTTTTTTLRVAPAVRPPLPITGAPIDRQSGTGVALFLFGALLVLSATQRARRKWRPLPLLDGPTYDEVAYRWIVRGFNRLVAGGTEVDEPDDRIGGR